MLAISAWTNISLQKGDISVDSSLLHKSRKMARKKLPKSLPARATDQVKPTSMFVLSIAAKACLTQRQEFFFRSGELCVTVNSNSAHTGSDSETHVNSRPTNAAMRITSSLNKFQEFYPDTNCHGRSPFHHPERRVKKQSKDLP